MKKLLVSLMLIIAGVVVAQTVNTLDPSQVYTTGNLVQPTVAGSNISPWVNSVYQGSLTCFAQGDPGYCGPNPITTPGYNINFSYGMTDIYQTHAIANVLPNAGTGLRVNGYNFGFMAKNGNGWDNGQQDYLQAYVRFNDSTNKVAYSKVYDLNYKFDWTTFNYSETFTAPFATKDLSTVTYGFVGYDTNYWAGPYGPEITNVNFSLKYSVDPCYINVLSSPTCPGYMDALNKLITPTTTETSAPVSSTSTSAVTTTTVTVDSTTVTTTTTTSVAQPTVVAPVASAPTTSATGTTNTQAGKETNNNSLALSIISKNQERDAAALGVAQNAVSQAAAAAQQSQQEAAAVAQSAVANSQAANVVSANGPQFSGTGIRANAGSNNSAVSVPGMFVVPGSVIVAALSPQAPSSGFAAPTQSSVAEQSQSAQSQALGNTTAGTVQNYAIVPPNFLTDKTNPLTEIVEGRQQSLQNNSTAKAGSSVNKNAGDNDAAGGVSINKIAMAPTGYGDYLNFVLKDAAFYAPKEVYRNQRTVDNARALRQMMSDSKHQEMVNQQYRIGN